MLRRTFLLALPVAVACTPTRPSPAKDLPASVTLPLPEGGPSPAPSSPDLWRWERGDGGWGESLVGRTVVVAGDATFTLGYLQPAPAGVHQDDERFGITRLDPGPTPRWQADLGEHFVAAGAMVLAGDTIYATHHCSISSGAQVSAVSVETGQVRWTVDLQALGPVDHSKYRNETQIELDERGLVIYGNEAQGAYTEVLDPATGAQRSHGRPDPRFVGLAWEGEGAGAPFDHGSGPSSLMDGGTLFMVTPSDDGRAPTTLARIDGQEVAWTVVLEPNGSCNRAALRRLADQLWVASYCPFSSGVQLFAFDPDTGSRMVTANVRGLGPIAHSEYFNEVELDELDGHVIVRGREAAGRYIEVVNPATGVSRVSLVFRD